MRRQDLLRQLSTDTLVEPRLRPVDGGLGIGQQVIDLARVDLPAEVRAPVLVRRSLGCGQAVIRHVLLVDDAAALARKVHRGEVPRPRALLENLGQVRREVFPTHRS